MTHLSQKRRRDAIANLSGPLSLPVLGAIQKLYNVTPQSKYFFQNFMILHTQYFAVSDFLIKGKESVAKYGNIVRMWAFNRLVVISADMELNEQILTSQQHIVKQRNYRMLRPWLGVGLLFSDGKKWFARRKIITPTFHFKILEEFVEIFDQQSTIFVEKLAKKANGQTPFNIYPYVCLAALDIIAETAMGTKVYAQSDKSTNYAQEVNQ